MAVDSELNLLSNASDVAYNLRCDLFKQCFGFCGPGQFASMDETYVDLMALMNDNVGRKSQGEMLEGFLMPFQVNRKPGEPVM